MIQGPRPGYWFLATTLVAGALLAPAFTTRVQAAATARSEARAAYGQLPLAFEINEGQSDPAVKFLCRGAGYGLFLTGSDTVLALTGPQPRETPSAANGVNGASANPKSDILRFRLLGANAPPRVEGMEPLPGRSNYFIGSDPKHWRTNIPQYGKVKSDQVYPGIDLVYYGRQRQLEDDFQVAPGADPGAIQFMIEGVRKATLDPHGDLVLQTTRGDVIEQAPLIYQEVNGRRRTIDGGYQVRRIANRDSNTGESFAASFRVASYDRARPLVIDPVLIYSTYLAGSDIDDCYGIAVDGSGNAYVTGQTNSSNFPTTAGAFQAALAGSYNAFVVKLNPALSGSASLVYSTYLGGGGADYGQGIAVDGSGNAYITGQATSSNFPTTAGAFQIALGGSGANNAFVTELNATGTGLVYSTYLGGDDQDQGNGIALDGSGDAYVIGYTSSSNFPTTAGAFQTALSGSANGFVTELNATGSGLVYSTYLVGSDIEYRNGIAVDGSGDAYVTGYTSSSNFPTTAGAFQTALSGSANAFVTELNAAGSRLVYSTYLGGNDVDYGQGIAVDGSGNAYVAGYTSSSNFPTTAGAFQTALGGRGATNAFVTKLNPALSGSASLVYSTYLGGSNADYGQGIAVDGSGNAYVAGSTNSPNFPTAVGAFQAALGGGSAQNAFVTELNATGAGLVYSTYLGGNDVDYGQGIALDGSGNAYVTGYTSSSNFPTTAGAFQTALAGTQNAFLAEISAGNGGALTYLVTPGNQVNGSISPNGAQTVTGGSSIGFTATPANGYVVDQWLVNGNVVQTGGTSYTLTNVNSSATVQVTFMPLPGPITINNYDVEKWQDYLQNSPAAPVNAMILNDPDGDYNFQASISGTNVVGITPSPSVKLPNATVDTLIFGSDNSAQWGFSNNMPAQHNFNTKAALDAAFPDGTYTMSLGGTNVTLNLAPESYPVTPMLTSGQWDSAGNLAVGAAANYTFKFNKFAGYSNGGFVELNIFTIVNNSNGQIECGDTVFKMLSLSTAGDPLPTSFTLPANTLQAGATYYAELSFVQFTTFNDTTIPAGIGGFAAFRKITAFDIDTVGASTGQFSFSVPGVVVENTEGDATVTVGRNFSGPASVEFQTVDDTAMAGAEYTGTEGTLSFAGNQTQATINIPILPDASAPATTDFSIQLLDPSSPYTIGAPASAGIFILNSLSGNLNLLQGTPTLPQPAPASNGSIKVNLSPPAADGQWRLFGELNWRDSGETATGLTSGNYEVEFKTAGGYQQPDLQVVPLLTGEQAVVSGTYTLDGSPATGSLEVNLAPQGAGGWRFQGETAWRSGGATVANLNTGDYILEFEPVAGLATPSNCEAVVYANELATVNITYLVADSTMGQTPVVVSGSVAQTKAPYVFTGQIQTDEGLGSGFVPLDRVVVTAAHVLFDDSTLSYIQGVRWFFQYENGVYEAPAQIPAGSYVLSGYAAQRAADIGNGVSPGVATAASRKLDAAALYFLEPAARGGQSGYLASDAANNPWLTGTSGKFIAGYPVTGVASPGSLYATPVVASPFQYVTGSLFSTGAITSFSGNSGGPLFVQYGDGNFYPAAIYLGGSEETIVHAIDDNVIALMNEAEVSGNGGANNSGAGIIQVTEGLSGLTANALGGVTVTLAPPDAASGGAYWEIGDGVKRYSGQSVLGLTPGSYTVKFYAGGPGYSPPSLRETAVSVTAGNETDITATYTANAPTITSGTEATAIEGQPFSYQIKATPYATGYSTVDSLPSGLTLDGSSGLISGTVPIGTLPSVASISLQATNNEGPGPFHNLALNVAAPGQLAVTVSGQGSVPKAFASPSIKAVGAPISITATPARGCLFAYWSNADTGAVLSTQPLYKFLMPAQLDLQANFVSNPFRTAAGSYLALFQGGNYAETGFARIAVTPAGGFTATVNLGGNAVALRGAFDNLGQYEGAFALPGSSFKVNLFLTAGGVMAGVVTREVDGSQIQLNAQCAAPRADQELAGAYTVLLPAASGAGALPAGNGYGTLTLSKTGAVKFTGKTGDGLPVTLTGFLDGNGVWPFLFYKPATKTTGAELLLGDVTFPIAASGTAGTLTWYRSKDSLYHGGISGAIPFVAGRYTPPAVIYPSSATVTFSGGDLVTPLVEPISIGVADRVTPGGATPFSLRFAPATGLFTGAFPDKGAVRAFSGAVLQSGTSDLGLFQEPSGQTGSVLLEETP